MSPPEHHAEERGPGDEVADLLDPDSVERFRREAPGVEFVEPLGAFYFFFRVDGITTADVTGGQAFCDRLMKEEGVALVPGAAFGDDRWVRLSYAVSDKELGLALDRVLRFIARLSPQRAA